MLLLPLQYFSIHTSLQNLINISIISVYCLAPPTIEHARHSALPEQATFDLDSTVQYHCFTGYATAGFPRQFISSFDLMVAILIDNFFAGAKCLAIDGQASWYGPDISCEREYWNRNQRSLDGDFYWYFEQLVHVDSQPTRLMVGMLESVTPLDAASLTTAAMAMSWLESKRDCKFR